MTNLGDITLSNNDRFGTAVLALPEPLFGGTMAVQSRLPCVVLKGGSSNTLSLGDITVSSSVGLLLTRNILQVLSRPVSFA